MSVLKVIVKAYSMLIVAFSKSPDSSRTATAALKQNQSPVMIEIQA